MDEELFELAKDNDLSLDEAQEVQDLADELGSFQAVAGGSGQFHIREVPEQKRQLLAGQRLVVGDDGSERSGRTLAHELVL